MKITVEHYDSKYTFEEVDELDIYDMQDVCEKMLFAVGFQYGTIKEIFVEEDI